MAFHLSRLGLPTSPYQLATLFLGIAYLLHAVTFIPPSSLVYLVRADFRDNSNVTSTAWFSTIGHCIAEGNKDVLASEQSRSRCSYTILGYDVAEVLEQKGITTVLTPGSPMLKTTPLAILNAVTMTLSLLSIVAYQAISRCRTRSQVRPHWSMYLLAVGNTMLAFLVSVLTFAHEHGFLFYIAYGRPTEADAYTTAYGPAAYALIWALPFELAASAVGFYTCIGGKYDCEEDSLLEDDETLRLAADGAGTTIAHGFDEKCRV